MQDVQLYQGLYQVLGILETILELCLCVLVNPP